MEVTGDEYAHKFSTSRDSVHSAAARGGKARGRNIVDQFGFWLFVAMVVVAPIPDGSVGPLWVQVWTIIAAVAAVAVSYRGISPGGAGLFGGLVAVLCVYLSVAWLQSVSPGPNPFSIWYETSQVLGTELAPISSSVRNTPLLTVGRALLVVQVLMVAIALGTDRSRAALVMRAVVAAACLYGAIGLFGLLLSVQELRPFEQADALSTFFLNKNTSATYLGTAFLIVFGLSVPPTLSAVRKRQSFSTMFRVSDRRAVVGAISSGVFLLILLPLTLSRAGVMLTVLIALSTLAVKLKFRRKRAFWAFGLSLMVLFSLIFALSGESWHKRSLGLGFDTLGRLNAYYAMLQASTEHPLLGLGLGSFSQSFPQYRGEDLGLFGTFNIGHSTPVELIFEGGYPLALSVFTLVGVCFGVLVRGVLRRPNDPYVLAALLVGLLGLLHTIIDFSLQIPGYLITYLAVVGIGLGRSFLPRQELRAIRKKVSRRVAATSRTEPPRVF